MPKKLHEGGPAMDWQATYRGPEWAADNKELDARKKGSGADFSRDMKVGPYNSRPVKKYEPVLSKEDHIESAKARKGFKPYDPVGLSDM